MSMQDDGVNRAGELALSINFCAKEEIISGDVWGPEERMQPVHR